MNSMSSTIDATTTSTGKLLVAAVSLGCFSVGYHYLVVKRRPNRKGNAICSCGKVCISIDQPPANYSYMDAACIQCTCDDCISFCEEVRTFYCDGVIFFSIAFSFLLFQKGWKKSNFGIKCHKSFSPFFTDMATLSFVYFLELLQVLKQGSTKLTLQGMGKPGISTTIFYDSELKVTKGERYLKLLILFDWHHISCRMTSLSTANRFCYCCFECIKRPTALGVNDSRGWVA